METFISIFAKPMGFALFWLYELLGDYGLAIIVFTLLIRTILFPLVSSQQKQSAKMSEVQPKLQKIQKQYANNKEMQNQKLMELYAEENINPAKGCLPLLLQMPIILGLFAVLRNPLAYIDNTSAILAIHESFLWIPDLSQPDEWILPILAAATTYISTRITTKSSAQVGSANSSMKIMMYVFPIMILWWGRSFPAGLTLYWFVGTLYQCIQQQVIARNLKKGKEKREAQAQWEAEHAEEVEEEIVEEPIEEEIEEEEEEENVYTDFEPVDDYSDFYTEEELAKMAKKKNKKHRN